MVQSPTRPGPSGSSLIVPFSSTLLLLLPFPLPPLSARAGDTLTRLSASNASSRLPYHRVRTVTPPTLWRAGQPLALEAATHPSEPTRPRFIADHSLQRRPPGPRYGQVGDIRTDPGRTLV